LQRTELVGVEREEAERQMQSWGASAAATEAWDGPPLNELALRIIAEAGHAYASLISELRVSR